MFELGASLLLLAQSFAPVTAVADDPQTEKIAVKETESVSIDHAVTLEDYVREYFQSTPILAEIAKCESHFRHYNNDGTILRGKVNKGDIGIMQINKYYHEEDAEELGHDIYTIEGNLEYAKHIYEKSGTKPWVHSKKCWGNSQLAKAY